MDQVRSSTRNVGIPAQKVRLIVDLVRGRPALEALDMLKFMPNAAAKPVAKTIRTAVANAEETVGLSRDDLIVSEIFADEGPTMRRGRAGARGRYKPLLKRSSHITVVLQEREEA
jgi:large subunit ribosomal protein L22